MIFVLVLGLAIFAIVAFKAAAKGKDAGKASTRLPAQRKAPLTDREQAMFNRLTSTFPSYVILAQVSFSALLSSKDRVVRNGFDKKVADFVICTKAFIVVAIVELDDSSHKGREEADAQRAQILTNAGYQLKRYAQIPDERQLIADFAPVLSKPPALKSPSRR